MRCPAHTMECSDARSLLPTRFVAFACRYHPHTDVSLPSVRRRRMVHRGPGAFALRAALPLAAHYRMETTGPPKFLGDPYVRALFSDPGGTFAPGPTARRCGLPLLAQRRLPRLRFFRGSMARPAHPLSTLRRMDHSTTTQDSLPAAGQLCRTGCFLLQGPNERFQLSIASSFPKLSLAQTKRSQLQTT